jgi:small multidrug resistance pump
MGYLYLGIAIISEVIGTSALKPSEEFTKPIPSLILLVAYGISFLAMALSLRTIPVGIAYAIWAGAGIVLVAGASWVLFAQKLDMPAMVGITLITAGIMVVHFSSVSVSH